MSFVRQHSIALIALGVAVGTFAFAYIAFNPVETAVEEVARPAAESVGLAVGRCPSGWDHTFISDHAPVETCSKGSVVVTMHPNNLKLCNYWIDTMDPTMTREQPCSTLMGWPADWVPAE